MIKTKLASYEYVRLERCRREMEDTSHGDNSRESQVRELKKNSTRYKSEFKILLTRKFWFNGFSLNDGCGI